MPLVICTPHFYTQLSGHPSDYQNTITPALHPSSLTMKRSKRKDCGICSEQRLTGPIKRIQEGAAAF